jgi:hypothetical protein
MNQVAGRRFPAQPAPPARRQPHFGSNCRLSSGLGFRWGPEHSRRLRDTERPWAKRYIQPNALLRFAGVAGTPGKAIPSPGR